MKNMKGFFFIFLVYSGLVSAQHPKIDWEPIIEKNKYQGGADSILVIKKTYFQEHKDTEQVNYCIRFVSVVRPVEVLYATSLPGWQSVTRNLNGDFFVKNNPDSQYKYKSHARVFDPENNIYHSYVFGIFKDLPLFYKDFYKEAVTADAKIVGDELIITQLLLPDKTFKRVLYLDNDIIHRVEILPATNVEIYNHTIFDFRFEHNKSFDSVCKEQNAGFYAPPDKERLESSIRDSLNLYKPVLLPIIDKPGIVPAEHPGKYYILDFWYIGCGPCVMLVPTLESINASIDTSKVTLLGVNPYDKNKEVLSYCQKYKVSYPQVDGRQNNLSWYKINSFPTVLILDSDLNVIKTFEGYSPSIKKEILKFLKEKDLMNHP
jgi:thiol-disulfide isomerase/thioredoxin